jgi:AcrR family transcriptional regulator
MTEMRPMSQDQEKTDLILETARKRFALYGFDKTTMREIADDLNMSKGSLYYYFPDKENLYRAIIYKEHELFIRMIQTELATTSDPAVALRKVINIRLDLFHSLVNLSRSRLDNMPGIHQFMKEMSCTLRLQEKQIICDILSKGVKDGIFFIQEIDDMADLLLDLLKGLRMAMLKEITTSFRVVEEYENTSKKVIMLADLFIKAIRSQETI